MNKPDSPKERNLIKGAIRRVFSRSELRRAAMKDCVVPDYHDPSRPRVTKWATCSICKELHPAYKMEIDHSEPVIPPGLTLDDMTWDEVIDRLWCEPYNLKAVCKPCHKIKSKIENFERRRLKRERKNGE